MQAKWRAEGLQSDSLSQENGAIMANASRWSLLIDPQLQGRQWIAAREAANNLCILQQSQPNYIDRVLQCVQEGRPLLLENLPEDIDAVLDPVVGKQIIRRGKGLFLKLGDAEVEYDPNFRFFPSHTVTNLSCSCCCVECGTLLRGFPPSLSILPTLSKKCLVPTALWSAAPGDFPLCVYPSHTVKNLYCPCCSVGSGPTIREFPPLSVYPTPGLSRLCVQSR